MGVEIAPVGSDQVETFLRTSGLAFGFDVENEGRITRFAELCEWDRTRVAYDGTEMVGTSGAFSLDMTVPGSTMACGGTTIVSVLPTHRRRGILRAMMDAHLADVRDRAEPIAALWASDSAIYGRFGYGCAATGVDIEVECDHSEFHRLAPNASPIRLIDKDEAEDLLPPFYDSTRLDYPGHFARSELWWTHRRFIDERDTRQGATAYRYAVAEVDGQLTGYVQYRFKEDWRENHGRGSVKVRELLGADAGAWAGLWRYLLDHDLIEKVAADDRSADDPIFELLAGRRRAKAVATDSLWVRIMDTKAALEGRRYSGLADLAVELHDPLDGTTSTWRLDLHPEGGNVSPDDQEPDVSMDLEDLGACFMGWSRFETLHRAGRLTGDPVAVSALDRAFTWSPGPWCPEPF